MSPCKTAYMSAVFRSGSERMLEPTAVMQLVSIHVQPELPWGLEAVKNWAWRSWWAVAALACKVTLG